MEETTKEGTSSKSQSQEIRTSSKQYEYGRRIRKALASQIVEDRKEFSNPVFINAVDLINEASIISSDLDGDTNLRKENFIDKARQIEESDWKKADRLSSYINTIFEIVASGQMNEATRGLSSLHEKIRSLLNLDEELLKTVSDLGTRLKQALRQYHKNILSQFYKEQEYRLNVLNKNHHEGNQIGEVSESYNVIFVHGVQYNQGGYTNLLKKESDWQTKFNILFGFDPSISASSIKEGDKNYNAWAGMGVILNGGTIMQASPVDLGSRAYSLHERVDSHHSHTLPISDQIKLAISDRPHTHNEFIINNPKFAGIYLMPSREVDVLDKERDSYIHQIAINLQIPIYIIHNGQVYDAQVSKSSEAYSIDKIGNPISPQELIARKFTIASDKKEMARRKGLEFLTVNDPETAGVR